MRRPRLEHYAAGLLITSILLIVVCQCWALFRGQISAASLLLVTGTFAGIGGLGIAAAVRPRAPLALPDVKLIRDQEHEPEGHVPDPPERHSPLLRMLERYMEWRLELTERAAALPAFDQALREMLGASFDAANVRCWRVLADGTVTPLRQPEGALTPTDSAGAPTRELVAQVARAPGTDLLEPHLDPDGEPAARWSFGITRDGELVGLVTTERILGHLRHDTVLRSAVVKLVTLFWRKVLLLDQLRLTCRTDGASGVLRRQMFFERARDALRMSLDCSEPVVLAVIGLEGLRRLDDGGHWRTRDDLVAQIGRLIVERSRSDDVVGRFSDERFVLLLRRMDTNLARLVMTKLAAAAANIINRSCTPDGRPAGENAPSLGVRVGLAGTGPREVAFETLLIAALGALDQARALQRPMWSDSDEIPVENLAHEG